MPQQQQQPHSTTAMTTRMHNTKQVSFCNSTFLRRSLCVEDMSQVEIDSTWITRAEYKRIVKREKALMNRLRTTATELDAEYLTTHGLEWPDSRMQTRVRMREGLLSVLLEQEQQRDEGHSDAEELARLSQSTTRKSAMLARERAIKLNDFVSLLMIQLDSGEMTDPAITQVLEAHRQRSLLLLSGRAGVGVSSPLAPPASTS
jgi:hypothetical protein